MSAKVSIDESLSDVDTNTRKAFLEWHLKNPEVWKAFERFALEAASRGRKVGAKAIAERVRWESAIERGEDWKVNNNFVSYLARIFAAKYPQYSGFFEFREVKGIAA